MLAVIGLCGFRATAPGGALPFKLSVCCFSMCFLLSEPRYARSLFLSTSPAKGGDNDNALRKKIRPGAQRRVEIFFQQTRRAWHWRYPRLIRNLRQENADQRLMEGHE